MSARRSFETAAARFAALPAAARVGTYGACAALLFALSWSASVPEARKGFDEASARLAGAKADGAMMAVRVATAAAEEIAAGARAAEDPRVAAVASAEALLASDRAAFEASAATAASVSKLDGLRLLDGIVSASGKAFRGAKADDGSGRWPMDTPLPGVFAHKVDLELAGTRQEVREALAGIGAIPGLRPGSLIVQRDLSGWTVARARWIVWSPDRAWGATR